jgi:hypothetical protein
MSFSDDKTTRNQWRSTDELAPIKDELAPIKDVF